MGKTIELIVVIIAEVSLLVLIATVLMDQRRSKINILFAKFFFSIVVWGAVNCLENEFTNLNVASWLLKLDFAIAPFIFYYYLLFCLNFPDPIEISPRRRYVIVGLVLIASVSSYSNLVIKNIYLTNSGIQFDGSVLFAPYGLLLFAYAVWGSLALAVKRKLYDGIKKVQLMYVLLGISITAAVALTINLVLSQLYVLPILVSRIGIFCFVIVAGFMAYAIIRYRLMDIRIFAARTLIFLFVYVPILSIPYIIGYYLKTSWVLPTVLETIFAPGGLFIYLLIQERAERKILQNEYKTAGKIRDLAKGLIRLDSADELARRVTEGLKDIAKAENLSLYILDESRTSYLLKGQQGEIDMPKEISPSDPLITGFKDDEGLVSLSDDVSRSRQAMKVLTENKIVIALPIREKGDILGMIFMGERSDGLVYSHIEVTAFDFLSKQIAFAVQTIQFIEEKEGMQRAVNEVQRMKEFRYLTSSIGHEVGNGIQSIADAISTFFVDPVLQTRFNSDKELEGVIMGAYGDISDNITNLKMVTGSLRNYIREEEPGEMVNVEIGDLIRRVVVLLKVRNKTMKAMNVNIAGRSEIKANPGALQAVFYNLLNNSYDAIIERENLKQDKALSGVAEYEGEVDIRIEDTNEATEITVRDNGIGMAEDVQSRIFTPLFTTKSHEVTKDSRLRGGTGIGMETIRKMIKSHKGKIEIIWSERGKGTEFLIVFPKIEGDKNG